MDDVEPELAANFCFILLRKANLKFVFRILAWFPVNFCFNLGFRLMGFSFLTSFSSSVTISLVIGKVKFFSFFLRGCLDLNFGFSNLSLRMKTMGTFTCLRGSNRVGPPCFGRIKSEIVLSSSSSWETSLSMTSGNFLSITPWSDFSLILKFVYPKALSASPQSLDCSCICNTTKMVARIIFKNIKKTFATWRRSVSGEHVETCYLQKGPNVTESLWQVSYSPRQQANQ